MPDIGTILTTALTLYALVTGVFIVSENRRPQSTFAWMLVFVFAPGGLLVYLLFGRDNKAFSKRVTLADLRGTVWVASFIYTECAETCPLQSFQMSRLQEEFAGSADLRLVSITVDPEHDTADVLARYAERYPADPERWFFLTGPKDAIHALAKVGFKLAARDTAPSARPSTAQSILGLSPALASHGGKGLILHGSRFALVDRQGRIRAYHRTDDPGSLTKLRANVRVLLGQS